MQHSVACMDTCGHDNGSLFNPTIERKIVRDIVDADHARFAEYVTSGEVSHLNDAVEHFQLVLDQCCTQEDIEGNVFVIISRNALALRPKGHLILHYYSAFQLRRLPGAATSKILSPIYASVPTHYLLQ